MSVCVSRAQGTHGAAQDLLEELYQMLTGKIVQSRVDASILEQFMPVEESPEPATAKKKQWNGELVQDGVIMMGPTKGSKQINGPPPSLERPQVTFGSAQVTPLDATRLLALQRNISAQQQPRR
jgi:hypothetical protein